MKSMPKRCTAVFKLQGHETKYYMRAFAFIEHNNSNGSLLLVHDVHVVVDVFHSFAASFDTN